MSSCLRSRRHLKGVSTSGYRRRVSSEQPGGPILITQSSRRKPGRKSLLRWIAGVVVVILIAVAIALGVALHFAEPILKARVVETLSTRFDSRVELAGFPPTAARGVAHDLAGAQGA